VADLITHTCVALLWKVASTPGRPRAEGGWRVPAGVATFVLGTCLPDLLGRVPAMALTTLRWSVPAIPEWTIYLWSPFHVPVGIAVASVLVAQAFAPAARRTAAKELAGGGMLHMAVDVMQTHLGIGYLLLFPFSMWDFELGWIGSEATVLIVPGLLPFTVLACWARWARGLDRRQPG
jgi:hypothetical protein